MSKKNRRYNSFGSDSYSEDTDNEIDKRAHHNALERKRRDHIKDNYALLKDTLPIFQEDTLRGTREQILTQATGYIKSIRKMNALHVKNLGDLKSENERLEYQIQLLQNGEDIKDHSEVSHILLELKAEDTTDEEDCPDNYEAENTRKRVKLLPSTSRQKKTKETKKKKASSKSAKTSNMDSDYKNNRDNYNRQEYLTYITEASDVENIPDNYNRELFLSHLGGVLKE